VTVLMTPSAVGRVAPGMVAMGRRSDCCGAGSGASARCSGGCWPTSPTVALAGVAASGREHAIRVRGRATTVIPRPPPRAFPANLAPTGHCSASHPMAGRAMFSSGHTCCWRVASGRAPLTLRPSVPHAKGSSGLEDEGDAHRTGRPRQEHRHPEPPWTQARASPRPSSRW
jgi:hypothetical protein